MARKIPLYLLVGAVLGAFLFPGNAQADGNDNAAFEGLIEVSEVLIDVLATNADGEVVPGLGVDDFIVQEDGEEVQVTSVSYYTTRYDDAAALGEGEVPASRYFVLFFQGPNGASYQASKIRQRLLAAREAQAWVEDAMSGSDWVAVVSYGSDLRIQQDFTQDRGSILYGIEAALAHRNIEKEDPRRRPPASGMPSLLRHLPREKALRKASRDMHSTLSTLAAATGYIVGRKNLVVFTHGFGGTPDEDFDRRRSPENDPQVALNDHNVAVYPIHLGGRGVGQPHSAYLSELAESTGGVYYENLDHFREPLEKIADENYGYYVLSYQAQHPAGEVGYSRVEVRARDENVEVRARQGYRYGL